jgi:MYXO-CTERM domain-containing protein
MRGARRIAAAAVLVASATGCGDRARAPSPNDLTTARGAISVSQELILDPPFAGASRYGRAPAVAFDGQNFLVVYGDGQGVPANSNLTATISAARVTPAGEVLDRPGNLIGFASTPTPVVAFGGGGFLVAWQDGYSYDVYFRRLGADGKTLGTATRVAANDLYNEYDPSVAFDGTNFVVTFRTSRNQILAARFSPAGAVLDSTPKVIVDVPASSSDDPVGPRLAFDGSNYQLVWQTSGSRLLGVRFTPALAVVAGSMGPVSPAGVSSATAPALAFGNGQHLLAWTERATSADPGPAIRAARLDPAGTLAAPITVAPAAAGNATPAVAFDGSGWLVVWTETTGSSPNLVATVASARVDATGALVDTTPVIVSDAPGSKVQPGAGCGGGTCLAAWGDGRTYSGGVFGARVAGGTNADPNGIRIAYAYNFENQEAIASNGAGYLVVWIDSRDGGRDVYAARVDATGTTLDLPAHRVSTIEPTWMGEPAVASDGTNYLVLWDNGNGKPTNLGVSVVDGATGAASPQQLFPVNSYEPAAVFGGSQYLALWSASDSTGTNVYVFGARFDRQGNMLDTTPIQVMTTGSTTSYNVKVATDGTDFLAVWQASSVIMAARIDKDGKVLDVPPLTVRPGDVTVSQSSPGVAFDGTSYLVVWRDLNFNVRGAHVGRDGSLPDATSLPILVSSTNTLYDAPALAFDGTNFALAYERDVDDANLNSTASLLLQVFSPTLAAVAGGGVTNVCVNCTIATTPTVAAGNGQALMGFVRPDTSAGFEVDRVRMVMFTETAVQGTPCTAGSSCPSGQFCVDGVCCDTACAGGTRDCQACSVAAGAAKNGTCGPVVAGQSCTAGTAAGVCTSAGSCMAVPPDAGGDATTADGGRDGGSDAAAADAALDRAPAPDATGGDRGPSDGPDGPMTADGAGGASGADAAAEAGSQDAGSADAGPSDAGADRASPPGDGSARDSGGDGGVVTSPPGHAGCGCAAGGAASGGGEAALAALALASLLAGRSTSRRRRTRGRLPQSRP